MADIKEKMESELKTIKSLCETMENAIKTQMDRGLDKVNTHEMYEAVDIYKDLSEVKKNIIEGCYKMQIMEAMEEESEKSEEEEPRFYRGQPRSMTSGRYMRRGDGRRRNYEENEQEAYYRDMDRGYGRMYFDGGGSSNNSGGTMNYSEGYNKGYSEGQSRGYSEGQSRGYEEGQNRGYQEGQSRGYRDGQRTNSRDYREGNSGRSRRSYMESKESGDKQMKMQRLDEYMNELSSDMTEMISGASPEERTMLKAKMQSMLQKLQ